MQTRHSLSFFIFLTHSLINSLSRKQNLHYLKRFAFHSRQLCDKNSQCSLLKDLRISIFNYRRKSFHVLFKILYFQKIVGCIYFSYVEKPDLRHPIDNKPRFTAVIFFPPVVCFLLVKTIKKTIYLWFFQNTAVNRGFTVPILTDQNGVRGGYNSKKKLKRMASCRKGFLRKVQRRVNSGNGKHVVRIQWLSQFEIIDTSIPRSRKLGYEK